MMPFCSSSTLKAEPCFESNPACWVGRKIPKTEKGICPRPCPAAAGNVFHCSVLGAGPRRGRDVTELPHPRGWLVMRGGLLVSRVTGN